ncbi:MAG TPA: PilW family protein [Ramlibacter sp.]|nr:PilW family protein [Ramlibacter sp.]
MVSLVIGLFIVLALITLLINVNRNNSELTRTNRVIENGRFALQLLAADVSHAGFWGGFVPGFDDLTNAAAANDVPTAVPDPCLALASWDAPYGTNLIGIPVQVYEIPAIVPSPTLSVCATKVTSPQAKTDVLVVRHVDNCAAGVDPGCPAVSAADVYFQMQRCSASPVPPYTMGTPAMTVATPLYKRNCLTLADPFKLVSNLYYVRNYAVTAGDGIPTLMRSQFTGGAHQTAEAMIEGIEGFRVEVGIDSVSDSGAALTTATFNTTTGVAAAIAWADPTNLNSPTNRGDGLPDGAYVRCTTAAPCTPFQLMNAVAVKIYVLARTESRAAGYTDTKTYNLGSTTLGPFNDSYKRHLFTQTVRLTNVSMRRETP